MTALPRERIEEIAASISSGFEPEPPIVEALMRVAAEVEEKVRAERRPRDDFAPGEAMTFEDALDDAEDRAESAERRATLAESDARQMKACWDAACNDLDEAKRLLAEAEKAIRLVKPMLRHDTGCHPSEGRHTDECLKRREWGDSPAVLRALENAKEEGR